MLVVIRGAGDLASGIAVRLHRSGADVVMLDVAVPTAVRRTVSFSEAIRLGEATVEDVHGVLCADAGTRRLPLPPRERLPSSWTRTAPLSRGCTRSAWWTRSSRSATLAPRATWRPW